MDFNRLHSWLGLPPGPWPPDHYTLLGYPPGLCAAAAVEERVLAKMEVLRQNQLRHPELVTEGMNRLAQALIALTDAASKAAYDAELGIVLPAEPAPPPDEERGGSSVVVAEPLVGEDIFSDDDSALPPVVGDGTQEIAVRPGEAEAERRSPDPRELADELPPDEPADGRDDPESRRRLYTRLALIRRALRAWDGLCGTIAEPNDRTDRPIRVVVLLEAVAAVRAVLPRVRGVIGGDGEAGGLVAAVVRQPLLLDTFRRLLPGQRRAIAADWQRGRVALQAESLRLRNFARIGRRPRPEPVAALIVIRRLIDTPEAVPVVLGLLAAAVAVVRWLAR